MYLKVVAFGSMHAGLGCALHVVFGKEYRMHESLNVFKGYQEIPCLDFGLFAEIKGSLVPPKNLGIFYPVAMQDSAFVGGNDGSVKLSKLLGPDGNLLAPLTI